MNNVELMAKAEFARFMGIAPSSVTRACRTFLSEALVGKRINVKHPLVQDYIRRHKKDSPEPAKITKPSPRTKPNKKDIAMAQLQAKADDGVIPECEIPDTLAPYVDFTLRQILQKYGTEAAFVEWLKAVKTMEEIEERRLKNADKRGQLVSRELIRRGVIDVVNTAHLRMLSDGAKAIASEVSAMSLSGSNEIQMQDAVADRLTKFIKPCKARMERTIKNA